MKNLKVYLLSISICLFLQLNINANESLRNDLIESYFTEDCKLIYDQVIIDYFAELEYEVTLINYNESCTEAIVETTSSTKFRVTLSGGGVVGCEEIK